MTSAQGPTHGRAGATMVRGSGGDAALDAEQRAVDLVHLARQTFGDRRLEAELLQMFARQAAQIDARLGRGDRTQRDEDLLHRLVGSARVVGAHRVATLAAQLESMLRRAGPNGTRQLAVAQRRALRHAIGEASGFIERVLAE